MLRRRFEITDKASQASAWLRFPSPAHKSAVTREFHVRVEVCDSFTFQDCPGSTTVERAKCSRTCVPKFFGEIKARAILQMLAEQPILNADFRVGKGTPDSQKQHLRRHCNWGRAQRIDRSRLSGWRRPFHVGARAPRDCGRLLCHRRHCSRLPRIYNILHRQHVATGSDSRSRAGFAGAAHDSLRSVLAGSV